MLSKHLAMALLGTALISAPALAQTQSGGAAGSTNTGSSTTTTAPMNNSTMGSPAAGSSSMTSGNWMTQEQAGQWRASKLEGLDVYNNNNEKIGDISEVLIDQSGKVQAVVIGVGGFLGIGERDVAVPFDQIKFVNEPRSAATASNTTTGTAGVGGTTAGTTTTTNNTTAANNTTMNTAPNTTGSVAANNTNASNDMNRSAPDHAMLNMTKDQLKSAPEFKYNR